MVMLQQMIVMFLMMAVGYLCYRKQILTEEVSKKVSAIVVNVANPCMILSSALTDQQMQGKELVQTLGKLCRIISVVCRIERRSTI